MTNEINVARNIFTDAVEDLDSASYALECAAKHMPAILEAIETIGRINQTFKTKNLFEGVTHVVTNNE